MTAASIPSHTAAHFLLRSFIPSFMTHFKPEIDPWNLGGIFTTPPPCWVCWPLPFWALLSARTLASQQGQAMFSVPAYFVFINAVSKMGGGGGKDCGTHL